MIASGYSIEDLRLHVITTPTGVTVDLHRPLVDGGEEYVRSGHGTSFEDALIALTAAGVVEREIRAVQTSLPMVR